MKIKSKLLLLVSFMIPIFSLTSCNETPKHVFNEPCPICGGCLDNKCQEEACLTKCSCEVIVKSVDIISMPLKTSYYPGEIFSPEGLVVKANLSNGKTKKYSYRKFDTWTHKDEPLTEDIKKITFTIPKYNFDFDVEIKVELPNDLSIVVDKSLLKETYLTTDIIDFTIINVRAKIGETMTLLKADQWKLYDGTNLIEDKTQVSLSEGEHLIKIEYVPTIDYSFTLKINDPNNVISPDHVEAEDCVYNIDSNAPYTIKEKVANAQYPDENGNLSDQLFKKIPNGASGTGAVSSLAVSQNGKKVYFKFNIKVPTTGEYDLLARVQGTGENQIKNNFKVSINNGEEMISTSTDTIHAGNQIKNQYGKEGFIGWYNMFWWNVVNIGTYSLTKGDNEIKITMPNGLGGNIDYFEVVNKGEIHETQLFSMREGSRVNLSTNPIYLKYGEKLIDKVATPIGHPCKYTLIYLRLDDGCEIPVTEDLMNEIDYTKTGEQEVNITFTKKEKTYNASFKIIIEAEEE